MIRFSCSACGGKFKVKDQFAGRKSKCPRCGAEMTVPTEDTWEEDDSPTSPVDAGPSPLAASSVATVAHAVQPAPLAGRDDDEPTPYRSPKPKPSGRNRLAVVVGASAAGLVALVAIGAALITMARARAKSTPLRVAKAEVPQPVVSPPAEEKPEEPKPYSAEEMPDVAGVWITFYIRGTLDKDPRIESVKVADVEVRPGPMDQRHIPWLWEATAAVTVARKEDDPNQAPTPMSMSWRILFRLTPENKGGECWREVTDMRFGQKFRKHFGVSEWSRDFRSMVESAWNRKFREWDVEMRRRGESNEDRARYLQDLKQSMAAEFSIGAEELQEILDATD